VDLCRDKVVVTREMTMSMSKWRYKYASEGSLDKTVFVKFKIGNNFKKNIDEHIQKNQKSQQNSDQPTDFKDLKKKTSESL
jgi:hypothetical protein